MKKLFKDIAEAFGLTREQQLQAQRNRRTELSKEKVNICYDNYQSWLVIDGFKVLRITNETNIRSGSVALEEVAVLIESIRDRYIGGKED